MEPIGARGEPRYRLKSKPVSDMHDRITLIRISLLTCGILAFSSISRAQDTVRIAGVEQSVDRETANIIVGEAYRRIGVEMEVEWLDGPEALEAANSGELDGELQRIDGITRAWTNLVQVGIPINYLEGTAFSKSHAFPVTGWSSLEPYALGIVEGLAFAEQGTQGMNVTATDSYDSLFDMLDEGQIDVAVAPGMVGRVVLGQREGTEIKELEGVLEILFLYHYVHRKNEHLVPRLREELKAMLLDGTTLQIRNRVSEDLLAGP